MDKKDVSIWNINSIAEFYMQIFGKYEQSYVRACNRFMKERDRFMQELSRVPFLNVFPSQANYFMCEVKPPMKARSLTGLLLKNHSILVKDCSRKKDLKAENSSVSPSETQPTMMPWSGPCMQKPARNRLLLVPLTENPLFHPVPLQPPDEYNFRSCHRHLRRRQPGPCHGGMAGYTRPACQYPNPKP